MPFDHAQEIESAQYLDESQWSCRKAYLIVLGALKTAWGILTLVGTLAFAWELIFILA